MNKYNLTFSLLYLGSLILFIIIAGGELVPVGLMLIFVNTIGFPGLFPCFIKEELSDMEISSFAKRYGKWTAIVTLLIFLLSVIQFRLYLSDIELLAYVLVILFFVPLFGYISRFIMQLYLVKFKDYRSKTR